MPMYPQRPTPRSRRVPLVLAVAFLAVAVLGVGGALAWLLLPGQSATPAPLTAKGVLVLGHGQFIWETTTCSGHEQSADLEMGTQVTVTSSTGAVLALGSIDNSTPIMAADKKTATGCKLSFTVNGVARGRGPYGIQFGTRAPVHVNEGELQAITVSIGV